MNYTTNYQLPTWVETDRIQMDDFNDMTDKLDAAIAAVNQRIDQVNPVVKLKEVVLCEQQRTDESEAIAAAAAALGMKVVRLAPQWAREHESPLYVAAGAEDTAGGYAAAARKVLKSGLKSPLLAHFAKIMEGDGAQAPEVL